MKKTTKRLSVYFLSLALVLPNFSMPVYAGELSGNAALEMPEQVIENNNEAKERAVSGNNREEGIGPEGVSVDQTTSGTFGDSEGFRWTYDESTYTLTITGEDLGINGLLDSLPESIRNNMRNVVFQDCVVAGGSMASMFLWCENLTSVDLSGLDTSKVTDMSSVFHGCSNLTSVNLNGIDTSSVTKMSYMFYCCSSLTNVNLSDLDTSSVTGMWSMFEGCSSLTSLDLSGFDTSNVTDMSLMFYECGSLTNVKLDGLNTSNVTDMSSMFGNCRSLMSLDLSGFDTANVKTMSSMFDDCRSLTGLDLSGFDTSNVTDMTYMFFDCRGLTSLDLSGFDTSNVTDMRSMFECCSSLTSLDLSGFDTSKVKNMSSMFDNCSSLTSVDLSGLDTSNVTDMQYMFKDCSGLTTIATPKVMAKGVCIKLPAVFENSKRKIVSEITSAHCNKTFTKRCDMEVYSITYYLNDGINNIGNPSSYTEYSGTITLREPTRKGYTFEGWYRDSAYTKKVTKIKSRSTGDKIFYAKWKSKTYGISYKFLKGGKNSTKNPKSYKVTTSTIELQKPTRKGYTFVGWYSDKKLNKPVTQIEAGSTGNVTLYAKWEATKYDITYEVNDGKNNSKNPASYKVTNSTITLKKPTKKGYTFVGWYNSKGKKVTKISKGSTGNVTLTAKWKKK